MSLEIFQRLMDQVDKLYEMPIPDYAVGTRILLIDPDISSLMRTTSLLEESTYKVTSTELPDVALSMMKERVNGYDLVLAALDTRGMDCFAFLRSVMVLSDIPVVLMSYKKDVELAARAIQQGACQVLEKPIKRDEARGLWQYVIRKRRRTAREVIRNHESVPYQSNAAADDFEAGNAENNLFGSNPVRSVANICGKQAVLCGERSRETKNDHKEKGKEVMVDNRRRKRPNNGDNQETSNSNAQTSNQTNRESKMDKGKSKKVNAKPESIKWNAELHEKFMKVLTADRTKATTRPVQIPGTPDATMLPRTATQLQSTLKDHNYLVGQRQQQMESWPSNGVSDFRIGADVRHVGNNLQSPGTILGSQYQNVVGRGLVAGQTPNISTEINYHDSRTGISNGLSFPNCSTGFGKGELPRYEPCFSSKSQFLGTGGLNIGHNVSQTGIIHGASTLSKSSLVLNTSNQLGVTNTINNFGPGTSLPNLRGRIEQIRHAYWTSPQSGTASNSQPTFLPQPQRINHPNYQQDYMVENPGSIGMVESFHSGGKRNRSQFDNFDNGYGGCTYEPIGGEVNVLGDYMIQNYGLQGSTSSSVNCGLSSSLNTSLPNPNLYPAQFSRLSSENYDPNFMRNACNIQMEPTRYLYDPNIPIADATNTYLLGSEEMLTGLNGANQELLMPGMTSDVGLAYPNDRLNDLGGFILEGLRDITPSEEFLTNEVASSSQHLIGDDISLDEIFAELGNVFTDVDHMSFAL